MKRKDMITIAISVVILVIAGGLIYRYFAPPTADSSIQVTVPRKVVTDFDQNQLKDLQSPNLKDYTPDITPNFPDKNKVF